MIFFRLLSQTQSEEKKKIYPFFVLSLYVIILKNYCPLACGGCDMYVSLIYNRALHASR